MCSFAIGMSKAVGPMIRCMGVLLGAALLFGTFLPSLVLLDFELHRSEIIRTKCVQRDRPMEQNCCQGKCHLNKELKKASGASGNERPAPRIQTEELLALAPGTVHVLVRTATTRVFAVQGSAMAPGHRPAVDHVPWKS